MVEYGPGGAYPLLPEMVQIEDKLRQTTESGIGVSVISVNLPGVDLLDPDDACAVARDANDEMLSLRGASPDRLAVWATLPMQRPEAAAAELARATNQGCCGAMIYSNVGGLHLDDPGFRVVFAEAERLNVPILLHPTYPLSARSLEAYALIPVLGFLFDTATATMRLILDGVFDRHPNLRLILGHAGSVLPYIIGRIDYESGRIPGGLGALQAPPSDHLRMLFVDAVSAWPPALSLVSDFLGVDRLLYASDHPFWDPARTHDAIAALALDDAARTAIERGNAISVLNLQEHDA